MNMRYDMQNIKQDCTKGTNLLRQCQVPQCYAEVKLGIIRKVWKNSDSDNEILKKCKRIY